jgi:hypothetical protein
MSSTPTQGTVAIDEARHRLEVLQADTVTVEQREHRRISTSERLAIIVVLGELHRLHLAVSEQRSTLARIAARSKPRGKGKS